MREKSLAFLILLCFWGALYFLHRKLQKTLLSKKQQAVAEPKNEPESFALAPSIFFTVAPTLGIFLLYVQYISTWVEQPEWKHLATIGVFCLSLFIAHLASVRRGL